MKEPEHKLSSLLKDNLDRALNKGDLSAIDELLSPDVTAPQKDVSGVAYHDHLKQLITTLRTAFNDLHFEFNETITQNNTIVCRSTMTGIHREEFMGVASSGNPVSVTHIHFFHFENGQGKNVWHLWDLPTLMKQMGAESPSVV